MLNYIYKYFKRDLFQVIYHVTFRCNARCSFCFNWKVINKDEQPELSLDELEKISQVMPNFSWLMLSGGEPVLRKDLVKVIGIFYRNNKIKHLTLPTNGLIPDKIFTITQELLSKYKRLTITVSFSLDSLGEDHDALRGVNGCYDKLMESYNLLRPLRKNKSLNVKFNSVIGNFNCDKLAELANEIRRQNPDMHTIDFIRGDLKEDDLGLPPANKTEEIIKFIKENYNYYQGYANLKKHSFFLRTISSAIQKYYLHLFQQIIKQKRQVIPCLAYKTNLVIYPYGDISFCEPLPAFANFRDYNYNYQEVIKSQIAQKQKKMIKNKKCHCYHPCYQYLNILFNPRRMIISIIKNVF